MVESWKQRALLGCDWGCIHSTSVVHQEWMLFQCEGCLQAQRGICSEKLLKQDGRKKVTGHPRGQRKSAAFRKLVFSPNGSQSMVSYRLLITICVSFITTQGNACLFSVFDLYWGYSNMDKLFRALAMKAVAVSCELNQGHTVIVQKVNILLLLKQ